MNNIEALNIIANILQIYNTILLQQDVSNNEVLHTLQEQNNDIINRLDRLEKLITHRDINTTNM